jgi:hypothetical protein
MLGIVNNIAHIEALRAKTTNMRASHLMLGLFLVFLSACRCKKDPPPDDVLARISCSNQNYIITPRGILGHQNFALGDIVMYDKLNHSINRVFPVPRSLIEGCNPVTGHK